MSFPEPVRFQNRLPTSELLDSEGAEFRTLETRSRLKRLGRRELEIVSQCDTVPCGRAKILFEPSWMVVTPASGSNESSLRLK